MDKKIAFIFFLLTSLLFSEAVEFGKITYLNGEVLISRNIETVRPIVASRIYINDEVLVKTNGAVRIKSDFQSGIALKGESSCKIISPFQYEIKYGTIYFKNTSPGQYLLSTAKGSRDIFSSEFVFENAELKEITEQNKASYNWGPLSDFSELYENAKRSVELSETLWRTAALPGWGHLYIDNPVKGWPMLLLSTYLLYNSLNINPAHWSSSEMQEIMNSKKTQFQQTYFIFWSWALLDIISETDNYNKKIMADSNHAR